MATLTHRAERALLQAMLADPTLVFEMTAYVDPTDFQEPRHREVYDGLKHAAGSWLKETPWEDAVDAEIGSSTAAELRGTSADVPVPAHVRSYASMVIEASFQRRLGRIAAHAEGDSDIITHDATRLMRTRSTSAPATEDLAGHAARTARAIRQHAARFTPDTACAVGPPRGPAGGHRLDEELVLGALITRQPGTRPLISALSPAMFTGLRHTVFTAIRALDAAGRPVDPLTVDWHLARSGAFRVADQSADGDEVSYVTRLAEAASAGDAVEAGVSLIRSGPSPDRENAPGPDRASRPEPPPPGRPLSRLLRNGFGLLQQPPEPPRQGQDPGPRR